MRAAKGLAAAFGLALASAAFAQDTSPPTPTPTPGAVAVADKADKEEKKESIPFRPIESNVIINLPSVDVPPEGTLTFLVTHRFQEPLQDGNIDNFFTLDTGNTWGFGLWYSPLKNLNMGFYRSSDLATYEASGQYELPRLGCFASSLRFGADWRTTGARPQSSLWAQAVLAYDFGKYVRITAVPTYLQRTNGDLGNFGGLPPFLPEPPHDLSCRPTGLPPELPQFTCSGLYENIFNVPVGASIAITHSITVHGEVYPRLSKVDAGGVGWAVTVEKSLLRHRFAFFAGNVKGTTVGQYAIAVPYAQPAKNVYIGFNLYRAWKLK